MNPAIQSAHEGARLWLPPLSLSGCVWGAMGRDTRALGLGPLHNHFPATPLASLLWWFAGDGESVPAAGFAYDHATPVPKPLALCGPFSLPSQTRNPGPIHVLQIMFLPDSLQALTGIALAPLVNGFCDARPLLPPAWRGWAESISAAANDDERLALIEPFLAPRWAAIARERPAGERYRAWMDGLAMRAATTQAGRSVRQMERRIKGWAGLPLRELRAMSRAEEAFFDGQRASLAGVPRWADAALDAGYADQAHMCRDTKRLTGFSPAELGQRVRSDPSFWPYRLWL